MLAMEFLVDKIPGLDTAWDAIHTFVRIPAGAFLAAGATGDTHAATRTKRTSRFIAAI